MVCRKLNQDATSITRKEYRNSLRIELPSIIDELKKINIAPVDLAQASIGPGMEIFSRVKGVINPDDTNMNVKQALIEINLALDEYLAKDENDLDSDTLFAITFFESYGYLEKSFDAAERLAKARNISVEGVVKAGIISAIGGKVKLLNRNELEDNWDPTRDNRICIWECTQYLIKSLELEGEIAASELLSEIKKIVGFGDIAQKCSALAYRLFNHCEKNGLYDEARSYNGLILSWNELNKLDARKANISTIQTNIL